MQSRELLNSEMHYKMQKNQASLFSQLFGANINTSGLDKAEKKLHSVSRVAQPKTKSKNLSLNDLFLKNIQKSEQTSMLLE